MKKGTIKLMNCDENILDLILKGDEYLAKELNILIPNNWTEFGKPAFEYSLNKIKENPKSKIWWTYLPILVEPNTLIGSCGFKGEPDERGTVEIGYEVAEGYRNKGYATEILNLLIDEAFKHQNVVSIQAHTLAEHNASVRVLKKCGFEFVEEIIDKEDGEIWKWQRN